MPLLQKADRVTVLTVIGGTDVSGPSAEQFTQYLRRNRIGAELKKAELDGGSTGETILATAQSLGCDLLIKGAYTQSAEKVYARNLPLSREMAIKHSKLQQRRLVQILADPKSMQNSSLHYFFSYLADFDVVVRKLISK